MDTIAASEELQKLFRKMLGYLEHPNLGESLGDLGYFHSLVQSPTTEEKPKTGQPATPPQAGAAPTETITLTLKAGAKTDDRKAQIQMEALVRKAYAQLKLPFKLKIRFTVEEGFDPKRKPIAKHIIAVASGKGGVGKSTVTANLAITLQRKGYAVGVVDADIYGPSLGKMFGLSQKVKLKGDKNRIYPEEVHGIKLISFAFLLDADQAVVWRGPMLGKAVEQFLFQVIWGELDFILIDLPPGTGDVQLSLAQLITLDGGIIVSTPQSMAVQDANRAARMFMQLEVPLLGVVENMAGFVCPSCQTKTAIFAEGGGQKLAQHLDIPLLGSLRMETAVMSSGESGRPVAMESETFAKEYSQIFDQIQKQITEKKTETKRKTAV